MSEIHIKYENLFSYAKKISSLEGNYSSTLNSNKNNGKTAYIEEGVRQLMDKSSTWGVQGSFNMSLPASLDCLIHNTGALFNNIAQSEKDKDEYLAGKY